MADFRQSLQACIYMILIKPLNLICLFTLCEKLPVPTRSSLGRAIMEGDATRSSGLRQNESPLRWREAAAPSGIAPAYLEADTFWGADAAVPQPRTRELLGRDQRSVTFPHFAVM